MAQASWELAREKVETVLETVLTRRRRQSTLAAAGPFLLVVTFIEDGLRILLRWSEQIHYMTAVMRLSWTFGVVCLLISAVTQISSSLLILRPSHIKPSRVKPACYALLAFVCVQPFMYGQASDVDFMCRSITLAGGLLLLIWSENDRQRRSEDIGLPQGIEETGADRLQLFGRMLLTMLFFFQALWSENGGLHQVFTKPRIFNILCALLFLGLAVLVCIGFKTEWSAVLLCVVLGISNTYMYPFWSVDERLKDFYRYYFFQTLSIIGGLMLLALHGPGGISLDKGAKKSI
uniref:Surfeit locus protein 4 n=1 Tax=Calcidiscus leptoporus TaxID=127549 RepID=A0A7S0IWB2_9EUKA|mmetsp:Transcript_25787/g.60201  ORF Transcript_25787/g.60201 Transcript_25787/m.60201 type:complete len:291 (+) Transcript_25787:12-884(+)